MCRRTCLIALPLLVVCLASEARSQDASQDLVKVQGRWERTTIGPNGQPDGRAVKDVHGNHETVTYYDLQGHVTRRHTAEFRLESSGLVRLFTFSNLEITEGTGKGRKTPGPISYIYRVDAKQFSEAWGFLPGQEKQPAELFTWQRGGSENAPAPTGQKSNEH